MCGPDDLKNFRKKKGWTQWDCANEFGVDQSQISRWERGVNAIPIWAFKLIGCLKKCDEKPWRTTERTIDAQYRGLKKS